MHVPVPMGVFRLADADAEKVAAARNDTTVMLAKFFMFRSCSSCWAIRHSPPYYIISMDQVVFYMVRH